MFKNLLRSLDEELDKVLLQHNYEKWREVDRRQEVIRSSLRLHNKVVACLDKIDPESLLVRVYQNAKAKAPDLPHIRLERELMLNVVSINGSYGSDIDHSLGFNFDIYHPGWLSVHEAILRLNNRSTDFWNQEGSSLFKHFEDSLGKDYQFCLWGIHWKLVLAPVTYPSKEAGEPPQSVDYGPIIKIEPPTGSLYVDDIWVWQETKENLENILVKQIAGIMLKIKEFKATEEKKQGDLGDN